MSNEITIIGTVTCNPSRHYTSSALDGNELASFHIHDGSNLFTIHGTRGGKSVLWDILILAQKGKKVKVIGEICYTHGNRIHVKAEWVTLAL